MKQLITFVAALVIAVSLSGCASQVVAAKRVKAYSVGQTLRAPVGGKLLESQTGTVGTVRHWVGILNSADGWKTDTVYSPDYVQKELLYSGISGQTIELHYREFRGGYAAMPFYQALKYDLSQSRIVTFQNFQIEVDSANNAEIIGKLLRD